MSLCNLPHLSANERTHRYTQDLVRLSWIHIHLKNTLPPLSYKLFALSTGPGIQAVFTLKEVCRHFFTRPQLPPPIQEPILKELNQTKALALFRTLLGI